MFFKHAHGPEIKKHFRNTAAPGDSDGQAG